MKHESQLMRESGLPPFISCSLEKLCQNLRKDLDYFWPAPEGSCGHEGREMHEENLILQLGAILKPEAYIYTQVSTDQYPKMDVDFVAVSRKEDWLLICEAKRGYGSNHVEGISTDIERISLLAKSKAFKEYENAYGLVLVTLWDKLKTRSLMRAWENCLTSTNRSSMATACRIVTQKLKALNASRGVLTINDYGNEGKHFLLYALFNLRMGGELREVRAERA